MKAKQRNRILKSVLVIFLTGLPFILLQAKQPPRLVVMFYNTENLFDTINDPRTLDDEFTSSGKLHWTPERYEKKLKDIAKVITDIGPKGLPDLIGLSEVENRSVLEDLISTGKLKRAGYGIVHEDSPDIRGIDVALLYKRKTFQYLEHRSIPIHFPRDTMKVRNILYVKGKAGGETFHIFVNHWKSRNGGEKATEQKRVFSAVVLRRAVDSILNFEPDARILIMGDFNDEPTNMSIMQILNATNKRKNTGRRDLYNLMYDLHNLHDTGTYSYKGHWNMLDQIIVSFNFLQDKKGWHINYDGGHIFSEDWMLYENPKAGRKVPNKTYGGPNYYGGVSDHLPVFCIFIKPSEGRRKNKKSSSGG